MRLFVGLVAALSMPCGMARAQVINGEGTYEGSSLHSPPPEQAEARPKDRKPPGDDRRVPPQEHQDD